MEENKGFWKLEEKCEAIESSVQVIGCLMCIEYFSG